ncbi:hypothetical protein WJX73_001936 [Symbiochloris irregularis]|uniref:cellulase n=1 Tax=Symbiochloris irregularis TaxID=706552 RepID=A0AAW1P676_9CHLO
MTGFMALLLVRRSVSQLALAQESMSRANTRGEGNEQRAPPGLGLELVETNPVRDVFAMDTEDQLGLLLGELRRIEGHQQQLETAVNSNRAIVVVPRQEVLEEEPPTPGVKPPEKKQNIVSGGLTGFAVAEDLLNMDFKDPEEVPEEFKAMAYNATTTKEIKKGDRTISGSFGTLDPASAELARFLKRLQQQQQQVLELIAEKEAEFRAQLAGRPYTPVRPIARGLSGFGSMDLAGLRAKSPGPMGGPGFGRPSPLGQSAPGPSAGPSRPSPLSQAGGSQKTPPVEPPVRVAPAASFAAPAAFATSKSAGAASAFPMPSPLAHKPTPNRIDPGWATPLQRPSPASSVGGASEVAVAQPLLPKYRQDPLPPPKPVDWAEPPLIELKFASAQLRVTDSRTLAHQLSISGTIVYLFFLCSFGFYAYARVGRTVSGHRNPGLVLYEVLVLLAEVGVFASSAMFGICRTRSEFTYKPRWWRRTPKTAPQAKTLKVPSKLRKGKSGIPALPGSAEAAGYGTVAANDDLPASQAAARDAELAATLGPGAFISPRPAGAEPSPDGAVPEPKPALWDSEHPPPHAEEWGIAGVTSNFNVQVLVYSPSNNNPRIQECLRAAHAMNVPASCSRTVYLIDPAMDHTKRELVVNLGLTHVEYRSALPDPSQPRPCNPQNTALNTILRRLYPQTSPASDKDIMAVFTDDQVADPDYLTRMLVKLERPSTKLVHCRERFVNLSLSSDLFNQMEEQYFDAVLPSLEAWGYGSCSDAGYVARVDVWQRNNWLPLYANAHGFALGMEARILKMDTAYVDHILISGIAPSSCAGVYGAKTGWVREHMQALVRTRPAFLGHLKLSSKMIYHSTAVAEVTSALTTFLWIGIPLIRILFNVFPFTPNRWFGIGFLAYYIIAMPLLYRAWTPHHLVSWWVWTLSSRILWWTQLRSLVHCCLRFFTPYTSSHGYQPPPRAHRNQQAGMLSSTMRRQKQKAVEVEKTQTVLENLREEQRLRQLEKQEQMARDIELGGGSPTMAEERERSVHKLKKRSALYAAVYEPKHAWPWMALTLCVISIATAAIGAWLLFATHGVISSLIAEQGLTLVVLSNNLTLIISCLWALANAFIFAAPVWYAVTYAGSGRTYDSQRSISGHGAEHGGRSFLSFWSFTTLIVVAVCAVIVAAACLGLGTGFLAYQGYSGAVEADFPQALTDTMIFYQAQRSGALTTVNDVVSWRQSSALTDSPPGGWYQGTNNLKMTFPMAIAAGQMAWGLWAGSSGYNAAPNGGLTLAQENLQWATNYLSLAQGNDSGYVVQVGNVARETSLWTRPEDMTELRPTTTLDNTTGASDMYGAAIAALAATSLALTGPAFGFSLQAMDYATSLYPLMLANEGLWSAAYPDGSLLYPGSNYLDDMMLGSAWMALATGNVGYRIDAQNFFNRIQAAPAPYQNIFYNWDNQYWAACLLMWQITGQSVYQQQVELFLGWWVNGQNGVTYTPNGLAWSGSTAPLRDAANAAFLALAYGQQLGKGSQYYTGRQYSCWGITQLRYILGGQHGTSTGGRSFMVGYGTNPPLQSQNPAASCPGTDTNCNSPKATSAVYASSLPNPNILYGALVAGPGEDDSYTDVRSAANSAVNIEYSGGLSAALAIAAGGDWSVCSERNGLFDEVGAHP